MHDTERGEIQKRIEVLKSELSRVQLMYEAAKSEDTKDDLWIVKDRLSCELKNLNERNDQAEQTSASKWISRIGFVEKIAGGACLFFLAFAWLGAPDHGAHEAAETGYEIMSKAHLLMYGAGGVVFATTVLKAILGRHRELKRLLKAIARDVERDLH